MPQLVAGLSPPVMFTNYIVPRIIYLLALFTYCSITSLIL